MNAAVAHWAACCIVWEYCAGREGTFVTATWAQITQHTQDKSLQQVSWGNYEKMYFWPFYILDSYSFAQSFETTQTNSNLSWCTDTQTFFQSVHNNFSFYRLITPRSKAWRPESMTSTLASQAGKKRPGSPIRGEILSLCQVEKRMPIFLLFRNIVKITGFGRKKSMHESLMIQLCKIKTSKKLLC